MYIYFIIFIIILVSSFFKKYDLNNNRTLRRNYCIGVTLVLILLSGMRHEYIGADTPMYKYIFYDIESNSNSLIETDAEVGFYYLMRYFGKFAGYQMFLMLVACLSIIPVGFIIYSYSQNVCLSFLIFYSSILFQTLEFAAERQAIAFGFVMMAYYYIMQRKLVLYLLCFALAFFFHRSCVIFIPCYWLYNLEIKKKTITIWGICLLISFVCASIVFQYLVRFWRIDYSLSEEIAGGERLFLLTCVFALIGFFRYKDYSNHINVRLPLIIYSISPLLWPIFNVNPALSRLQFYFEFFLALYVPNYLYMSPNGKIKKIIYFITLFLMLYVLFNMRTSSVYYPYRFYWE